jgi:hypothetical protein
VESGGFFGNETGVIPWTTTSLYSGTFWIQGTGSGGEQSIGNITGFVTGLAFPQQNGRQ